MYPGKVTRIHGDGSIDVKYDDGDSDRNLKPSHVKALDSGSDRSRSRSRSPSRGRMRVGTRVEARYRGRSKKYPGKISRVHADGTFDVACC